MDRKKEKPLIEQKFSLACIPQKMAKVRIKASHKATQAAWHLTIDSSNLLFYCSNNEHELTNILASLMLFFLSSSSQP